MSYEHGRILAVNETHLGSELVADHAAGVTSLTVEDPVDFDEDGGWLKLGDEVIEYTTYDDDTGEITLATALGVAASEGDRVFLWDELRQVVTTDKIAQVELDGDDDNVDPLEATIPLHLLDDLAEGIRGVRGESVLLEQDGDEWRIVDVLGLAAPSAGAGATKFWDDDVHVVATVGDQTATLTHTPIDGSLHMRWNELPQEPTEFTYAGRTVTVPDPSGLLVPGDRLWFMYAYNAAQTALDSQPTAPDEPWWAGDPSQGCTNGYPLGVSMGWEIVEVGSAILRFYVIPTFDLMNGAIFDIEIVAQLNRNPGGWGGSINHYMTQYNGWERSETEDPNGDLTATTNGTKLYAGAVQVYGGTAATRKAYLESLNPVMIGAQFWFGNPLSGNGIVLPGETGYDFLGTTDGERCRFWIGQQITTGAASDASSRSNYLPYLDGSTSA